MNKPYKWTLETGSKKYHCPSCTKKTFTRYVYTGTRDHVGEDLGRCDRVNNCGYHHIPEKDTTEPPHPQTKKDLPEPVTVFPSDSYLSGIKKAKAGNLAAFCTDRLKITKEHLVKWNLGARWVFDAFVLSNSQGKAVNIKFVAYGKEGKRDKSEKPDGSPKFIPHYLGRAYLRTEKIETEQAKLEDWQDYYPFDRCFYGEHLWDKEKDTCLVESEKTALIAAFFFPAYNWLATGGANGMKYSQFEIFHGYKGRIWNLVDNDPAGYEKSKTIQWLDRLAELRDSTGEIMSVNLFPSAPSGWDLADAVIMDGYRDPERLAADLAKAVDCRTDYEIDPETGEVKEKPLSQHQIDEKEVKRAVQVGNRIFEGKVNLITREDVNTATLCQSIASLGERGREIAKKVWAVMDMEESGEALFDIGLLDRHKNAAYFFKVAKAAGVDTRYIKQAPGEAAEGAAGINKNDWTISWPDKINEREDWDEWKMRNQIFTYEFIEHKNCIWYTAMDSNRGQVAFFKISNFVIRPLYLIKSKTDPKRLFEIKNIHGKKYILDIPAKALVSMTEFQVFCESHGNFLFEGSKNQFTKIKRKLYDQTKDAEEVKMLGWQDEGFYAFANGAYEEKFTKVDDYGIIKQIIPKSENEAEEKYFFIAAMSSIYKDEKDQYDLEKKFVYIPRPDVKFADWARLFHEVYGGNGILGMAFYISSLFRDMIYSRFKFFPHLFHFGPPGTGKSTMCWSIQYMFGLERKPFMLNAGTAVGFHRTFAQFRNAVVWFDEYNNTIEFKRVQDLKSAYDGAGHVKGEWSASGGTTNRTSTTPVEAACNISGQELPIADNALFKRCILLQYHQTIFSDKEKELLTNLQKLQEKGLSHITGALTRFRKKMEADYFRLFDEVEAEILAALNDDPTIESRIIKNMAVIATTYKVLANELPWPWNWPTMLHTITESIKQQNALISNAKETNQFWDAVDYCISEGELRDGEDYKVEHVTSVNVTVERKTVKRNLNKAQEVLFIRLATAHPKYMEALRKQGEKKGMDKGSLAHYLSHSPGFIGMVSGTRWNKANKSFTSSAYAFEYSHLEAAGYNFSRFVDESEHEEQKAEIFGPKDDSKPF